VSIINNIEDFCGNVSYLYKVVNNVNGRYYYGTHYGIVNDSYLGSGKAMKRAINKYGKGVFTKFVLKIFDDRDEAYQFESRFIKLFEIHKDPKSYNLTCGSSKYTVNDKRKRGEILQLDMHSLEVIGSYSGQEEASNVIGITTSAINKCLSNGIETTSGGFRWVRKEKYNEDLLSKLPIAVRYPHGVVQLDDKTLKTIKIFKNSVNASKEVGVCPTSIRRSCRDGLKSLCAGYRWVNLKNYNLNEINNWLDNYIDPYSVIQLDKDTLSIVGKFKNDSAAAKSVGMQPSSITKTIQKGLRYSLGGYKWIKEKNLVSCQES